MLILVRDAAANNHPILGIAAVGSPVVQLGVRDRWIGWSAEEFLARVREKPTVAQARWLIASVKEAISDVYIRDFIRTGLIKHEDVRRPTATAITRLRKHARNARVAHERYARSGNHKTVSSHPSNATLRVQAETFLFTSKRALALASALEARMALLELGMRFPTKEALRVVVASPRGRKAIGSALRYQKAKRVGIDMLDITVCGAVAPYTHLLGGKLVSLLLTSPEVGKAYRKRYEGAPSIIASAMRGKLVSRKPRLVLLGTTSLYGVASSQYNRLVIPSAALSGVTRGDVRFQELGRSVGFGSYHFSRETIAEMTVLAQQRRSGRRVNFIFGEGVNPKLRLVREALDAVGLNSEELLKHGSTRLVYGVPLATNFREVLTGHAKRPRYLYDPSVKPSAASVAIADYWRRRWLINRIQSQEVLEKLESHSVLHPVAHGARVQRSGDEADLPLFKGEHRDN